MSSASIFDVLSHSRDDDSYMYSFSSFTFHVCSKEFGDEIVSFHGSDDEDSSGRRQEGVQKVVLGDECVIATHAEGNVECIPLPSRIELASVGDSVVLSYADGRVETRPRREAIVTAKYGKPFSLRKLVRPQPPTTGCCNS